MLRTIKTLEYIWLCISAIALSIGIYKIMFGDYYSSIYFFVIAGIGTLMYLSTIKNNKKIDRQGNKEK